MAACQQAGCERPKTAGKHRCLWHWLARQSSEVQAAAAAQRLADAQPPYRNRVAADQWPAGERFCAGCQSFIPDIYVRGSRCRSCASTATHASRVKTVYGITGKQYDQLLAFQGGVCFICGQSPKKQRLAVDHDHSTGEVRGLLCAGDAYGCNVALARLLDNLDMARRALAYVEQTPMRRMTAQAALDAAAPNQWHPFS